KKSLPPSMKLTEDSKKIFFMVCYNIDKFREFVFGSSFLDRYEIPADRIEEIRADDIKLLQFGFEWLKASFFHAGQEKFQAKKR
ncbi:MAG: YkgJ family cysteine cluster protein, partial [Desulfotignum sp.]